MLDAASLTTVLKNEQMRASTMFNNYRLSSGSIATAMRNKQVRASALSTTVELVRGNASITII